MKTENQQIETETKNYLAQLTMTPEILAQILKSFETASDDVMRFNLRRVSIWREENRVIIEATNGHCMTRASLNLGGLTFPQGRVFYVEREQIPALKLLVKTHKKTLMRELAFETVSDGFKLDGFKILEDTTGAYPKEAAAQVIENAKKENYTVKIGLNAEYILAVADAIRALEHKSRGIVIHVKNQNSPVMIETYGENALGEFCGVIMPLRIARPEEIH